MLGVTRTRGNALHPHGCLCTAAKNKPGKEKWSPLPHETWQIALRSPTIFLALLSKRQAEAICQCLKGILGYLLRLLAKLAVEAGIIVGINAALKNPSLH